MSEKQRIAALEAEIALRSRTILFLLSEFVSRYQDDRQKIVDFLDETIPDMAPTTAEIAREILEHIRKE